jgi:hypothetical protein
MKVVCVDNSKWEPILDIGKIYDAEFISLFSEDLYSIEIEDDRIGSFYKKRFMSLKKYRKKKLSKLKEYDKSNLY